MKNAKASGLKLKLNYSIGGKSIRADFEVAPGERVALLGSSGSGKTTVLRIIAGLIEWPAKENSDGTLTLDGLDLRALAPERREIGLVFQDQALFPTMNVIQNAAYGLKVRGASKEDRLALAQSWLKRVGLDARADSPVSILSGGEKQRLAIVRALIWSPKLLLLDEPFSALDANLRGEMRALVRELQAETQVPCLLVTHDEQDVRELDARTVQIS